MALNKKPTPEQIEKFLEITKITNYNLNTMRRILGIPTNNPISEKESKLLKYPNALDISIQLIKLIGNNEDLSFKKINNFLEIYKGKTLYEIEVENKIKSELYNITEIFNIKNGISFKNFLQSMENETIKDGNINVTQNKLSITIDGITIELLKEYKNVSSNSNFNNNKFNMETLIKIYQEIKNLKSKTQSQNISEAMTGKTKNKRIEETTSPSLNYNY